MFTDIHHTQIREYDQILESAIYEDEAFSHLRFAQGYYLTDQTPLEFGTHWNSRPIGKYTLAWDRRTPAGEAAHMGNVIYVIGRCIHLGINSSRLGDIAAHLLRARQASHPAFIRALYDLSARYIVIHHGPDGTFLQTDATAMRSAYYTSAGGTVSSHASLTAQLTNASRPSTLGHPNWFKETKAATHPGMARSV